MKTDIVFENLKVGQEVYSFLYGKGIVEQIRSNDEYAILCQFTNFKGNESIASFTKDGKQGCFHNFPSLFLTNPFEKLNQERVIEVLNVDEWIPRVCIKVVDSVAVCWINAKTIEESKNVFNTKNWPIWREFLPEQPSAEQPKEITIDGVEYVLTPKKS